MAESEHRPLGQIKNDLDKAVKARDEADRQVARLRDELMALANAAEQAATDLD